AKELFEKSASQGNAKAQFLLGSMYYAGEGVDKNYEHAKEWFEKSAAQGEHNSQFLLGTMYVLGKVVRQDYG
ncbi:tetratricopeptide repeat protein, partial [Klebsiella aerogenes]|uniref:tetratricopeptide repeat protein n=1 Tax=Klebsiella aerogenes TaxID=548 RepID=UPI003983EAAE